MFCFLYGIFSIETFSHAFMEVGGCYLVRNLSILLRLTLILSREKELYETAFKIKPERFEVPYGQVSTAIES